MPTAYNSVAPSTDDQHGGKEDMEADQQKCSPRLQNSCDESCCSQTATGESLKQSCCSLLDPSPQPARATICCGYPLDLMSLDSLRAKESAACSLELEKTARTISAVLRGICGFDRSRCAIAWGDL